MSSWDWLQVALYLGVLLLCVKPLGAYLAAVFDDSPARGMRFLAPLEHGVYRLCGVNPSEEMTWKEYARAMLVFHIAGFVVLYALLRFQAWLLLNPAGLAAVSPDLSFNTAVSFLTNTNWQSYGGETTLSYLTQMIGLTTHNFVSPAAGLAMLIALARGFARREVSTIGNYWVDLTRATLYVMLPLSILLALLLMSQGVVQTFGSYVTAQLLQSTSDPNGVAVTTQTIAVGPGASQIAIKQLGTNGGGFFNVNSSHPLENPTPLSNFLQCLALLLIPAALCYTFGKLIRDTRQGWAILAAMTLVFVALLALGLWAETRSTPAIAAAGNAVNTAAGNMEGKEARFGVANSVLWATATTAASNGSVNSMHDSYTPLGGLAPMVLMQLGEVIFGGVGSGLYGMLVFVIITVFIAVLMVGRTPEYLGKKVEAFEMKMASIAVLAPALAVLAGTAIAVMTPQINSSISNPLPHGFSQTLYNFLSASNNNGSAFAGFGANNVTMNLLLGLCMLIGRFWVAVPILALAGSLAAKKHVPVTEGTLPTHTPLFIVMLIGVVLIVGALTFIPSLGLGPIAEHLEIEQAR